MTALASVLHVVVSLDHGGLERLVVRWTRRRNGRQFGSTAVCCLDEAGALASELPEGMVEAIGARRSAFPWDREAVKRVRAIAANRGASILHSHNLAAQQYAVLAARGTDLRVVHTEHGSRPQAKGIIGRLREGVLNRLTDRMVAVSGVVAERFAGRVAVIPNGVSAHTTTSVEACGAMRRELGLSEDSWVIGYVGRLATVKGVDRLLWAFGPMAVAGGRRSVLLLVGDGPDRDNLESQARRMGIAQQTVFAGLQEDARGFYDLMDCFVLPSRSEGLSVALLEAMAAGVPVLATDVGSNREVLLDGEVGVLLPADCGQWGDTLRRAVEDPEPFRQMAMNGRQHVMQHYSEDTTAEAYEKVYGDVARGA